MSTTTRRRRPAAAPLQVVSLTQHWRIIRGRVYRDAWVLVDGQVQHYSLLDGVAA